MLQIQGDQAKCRLIFRLFKETWPICYSSNYFNISPGSQIHNMPLGFNIAALGGDHPEGGNGQGLDCTQHVKHQISSQLLKRAAFGASTFFHDSAQALSSRIYHTPKGMGVRSSEQGGQSSPQKLLKWRVLHHFCGRWLVLLERPSAPPILLPIHGNICCPLNMA